MDSLSYCHPTGYQAARYATDEGVLIVLHTFEQTAVAATMEVSLPSGIWKIVGQYSDVSRDVEVNGGVLRIETLPDFAGLVIQLTQN